MLPDIFPVVLPEVFPDVLPLVLPAVLPAAGPLVDWAWAQASIPAKAAARLALVNMDLVMDRLRIG